jgi:chromosome segregation ATPase
LYCNLGGGSVALKTLKGGEIMADGYDGEIRIKAAIDTDEFDKKAKGLTSQLDSQNSALKRQQQIVVELKQKYSDLINGVQKTTEETGIEKSLKRAEKELSEFQKQYQKALSDYEFLGNLKNSSPQIFSGYEQQFKRAESEVLFLKNKIDETSASIKKLQEKLQNIKLNPQGAASAANLSQKIEESEIKTKRLQYRAGDAG